MYKPCLYLCCMHLFDFTLSNCTRCYLYGALQKIMYGFVVIATSSSYRNSVFDAFRLLALITVSSSVLIYVPTGEGGSQNDQVLTCWYVSGNWHPCALKTADGIDKRTPITRESGLIWKKSYYKNTLLLLAAEEFYRRVRNIMNNENVNRTRYQNRYHESLQSFTDLRLWCEFT